MERGDNHLLFTGSDARRVSADLAELRGLRRRGVGALLFKRARSPYWQLRYPDQHGHLVDESSGTTDRRTAQRLLDHKAYQASVGLLPGTATFERIIEHLVNDARARGLRSVARMARAGKALCAKFEGYRAEQIDRGLLAEYVAKRLEQAAPDTVNYELSIARRAYRLARESRLVTSLPVFPLIRHLRVRKGFLDPDQWARLAKLLRPDFRDGAEFAYLTGARQMETLSLAWPNVNLTERVIYLRETKSGVDRAFPYDGYPQLAALLERRLKVRRALESDGIISRWVVCFAAPVRTHGRLDHAAGAPLFQERVSGERGLLKLLALEWRRAAKSVGLPGLLFHDLRRSAARNLERAGLPRGVAGNLGGWGPGMYARYAIGAERENAPAVALLSAFLRESGWHSSGTGEKHSVKIRGSIGGDGRSRTYDTADMSRV